MNIEVYLTDLQAYHMESPTVKNITWDNLPSFLKDRLLQWLSTNNNAYKVFDCWDGNNPSNTLQEFVEKNNLQDNIHPLLKHYLYGKPINTEDLIKEIFEKVLPIYQSNEELREKLHRIVADTADFAKKTNLSVNFTSYNMTPKIVKILRDYEKNVL